MVCRSFFVVSAARFAPSVVQVFSGKTVNVSSGGMLIEVNRGRLTMGQLLSIDMSVPPTNGILEYGGRISSYARVIRVDGPIPVRATSSASVIQSLAVEFCRPPKLRI